MDKKSFSVLCLILFTLSFSVSATAALIPAISSYFAASSFEAGRLLWMYMLPYGLCALLWAPLSRKVSIKRILQVNLVCFSLSALTVGAAASLPLAFWGRMGMGVFGSSFVPLALIIIGKEFPSEHKPRYVGFLFSASFISSLLGVFLSGFLYWRLIYVIPVYMGMLALGGVTVFLKDFDYRGKFKISYRDTFRNKTVVRLFTFVFIASFLYHGIQQWLGVYLSKHFSFHQLLISSVFAVSSLAAIFSESIGGVCASRFGSLSIAVCGLISMGVFIFSLIFLHTGWPVFLVIVLWGMGWAFNHVGLSSILTTLPDQFLRDASSLNSSIRFFSGGLGALCGGKCIALYGFNTHFFIMGLAVFTTGFFLRRQTFKVVGG